MNRSDAAGLVVAVGLGVGALVASNAWVVFLLAVGAGFGAAVVGWDIYRTHRPRGHFK